VYDTTMEQQVDLRRNTLVDDFLDAWLRHFQKRVCAAVRIESKVFNLRSDRTRSDPTQICILNAWWVVSGCR